MSSMKFTSNEGQVYTLAADEDPEMFTHIGHQDERPHDKDPLFKARLRKAIGSRGLVDNEEFGKLFLQAITTFDV